MEAEPTARPITIRAVSSTGKAGANAYGRTDEQEDQYWRYKFDWSAAEERLNALHNFSPTSTATPCTSSTLRANSTAFLR